MAAKNTNTTTTAKVVPVSFIDALMNQGKGTTAKDIFARAYEWGSKQAIPMEALRIIWPESSIVDDKAQTYLDTVYHVQFCALNYWENADNHGIAEDWRGKGMDAWGKVLDMAGCEHKRHNTDWVYIVSRATIDGKKDKESVQKIVKPASKNAFRKRVEMLIGMAIHGFIFTNPLESLEAVTATRAEKVKKAAEKAERQAAKAEATAKKAQPTAEKASTAKAPKTTRAATKTASKPKTTRKAPDKAATSPTTRQDAQDELPTLDESMAGMVIPGETSEAA